MHRHRFTIAAALFIAYLAAAAACAAEIVLEKDLVYGRSGDADLKLDLARPAEGEGPFPAIVFVHGGGWYQGNRTSYHADIQEAARRGYVAVTITYRLMKFDESQRETAQAELNFPVQVHDAKAAVRWLRANAEKYKIDPARIGATGRSAGGHLSLMLGLAGPAANLEGESGHTDQSSRVQAVVNFFGPTDMQSCYEGSSVSWIFRLLLGGTPDEAAQQYKAASPVSYVGRDSPPVLTLHGDRDALVPVQQATLLDERMKKAGASHTLVVFEGQAHGFEPEKQREAMRAMWEFFEKHLKAGGG